MGMNETILQSHPPPLPHHTQQQQQRLLVGHHQRNHHSLENLPVTQRPSQPPFQQELGGPELVIAKYCQEPIRVPPQTVLIVSDPAEDEDEDQVDEMASEQRLRKINNISRRINPSSELSSVSPPEDDDLKKSNAELEFSERLELSSSSSDPHNNSTISNGKLIGIETNHIINKGYEYSSSSNYDEGSSSSKSRYVVNLLIAVPAGFKFVSVFSTVMALGLIIFSSCFLVKCLQYESAWMKSEKRSETIVLLAQVNRYLGGSVSVLDEFHSIERFLSFLIIWNSTVLAVATVQLLINVWFLIKLHSKHVSRCYSYTLYDLFCSLF